MKKKVTKALLIAALMTYGIAVSHAAENGGISLGGTRLVFDGSKDAASMTVTNSSVSDVWLMRFWVSQYGEKSDKEKAQDKTSIPFAVTPPLYRLDPKSAVQLRVNRLSDNLPSDRESVFYLNNLAIPPKKGEKSYQKAVQSGLQFAVNTRIKLFYRPAALNDTQAVKSAPEKLTVAVSDKSLVVNNPTPYFVTLTQLAVNGKAVSTDIDTMVSPFGSLRVNSPVAHGTFSYTTVDDRGMTTPKLDKTF
ncbi:molecular chaperone [Klebsiella aerogenes]|uniref:fimbrial biogenesis chaperone n=1 Tax=Klebsiella aerogenes TaxID=548 RepID=UPI002FFC7F1A